MENDNSLLTIQDASNMLSISKDTLRRWDKNGYLKAIRVGKRGDRRYRLDDLKKLIEMGSI